VNPVFDSLQMRLVVMSPNACAHMISAMNKAGFKVQLFADKFNARYYRSWHYCVSDNDRMAQTDDVLFNVVDMRLLAHDTEADVERQACAIVTTFLEAVSACAVAAL